MCRTHECRDTIQEVPVPYLITESGTFDIQGCSVFLMKLCKCIREIVCRGLMTQVPQMAID